MSDVCRVWRREPNLQGDAFIYTVVAEANGRVIVEIDKDDGGALTLMTLEEWAELKRRQQLTEDGQTETPIESYKTEFGGRDPKLGFLEENDLCICRMHELFDERGPRSFREIEGWKNGEPICSSMPRDVELGKPFSKEWGEYEVWALYRKSEQRLLVCGVWVHWSIAFDCLISGPHDYPLMKQQQRFEQSQLAMYAMAMEHPKDGEVPF